MSGRDERGRFIKGQSGNPKGRPPKAREERYLEIAMRTVSFKDWKAIIKRAANDAKMGDASARRFLADYLLGKPAQEVKLEATTDLAIMLQWDDDNSDADSSEAA